MAGANLIYGLGMLEMGVTFSFAQLVMDNEFAGMIKYALGGIPVNDATLSTDIIKEVGPFSDFLGHDDTFVYMRTQSRSHLIDRRMRENWQNDGAMPMEERAAEYARHLIETHRPDSIDAAVHAELDEIIAKAEAERVSSP